MNFLDKMERKYGRYALSHLTMYIIVTYIAGYIIQIAAPIMRQYLTLEPYYILHGQIWRLVSWILIPPSSLDIFTIIMLFFYYSIGTSLERAWGDFKTKGFIPWWRACRIAAYKGWIKHSNSLKFRMEYCFDKLFKMCSYSASKHGKEVENEKRILLITALSS